MKKGSQMITKLLIGLVAAVTAGFWWHHAFTAIHARKYTAQAEYSINWNQIGTGDDQYDPLSARENYDDQIAALRVTGAFVREVCRGCDIPRAKASELKSDLQHHLIVKRIGTANGSDVYRVQCSDDDQTVAVQAANLMARRLVAVIDVKSKIETEDQPYSGRGEKASAGTRLQKSREQPVRKRIA
jgi:hypothetical protein